MPSLRWSHTSLSFVVRLPAGLVFLLCFYCHCLLFKIKFQNYSILVSQSERWMFMSFMCKLYSKQCFIAFLFKNHHTFGKKKSGNFSSVFGWCPFIIQIRLHFEFCFPATWYFYYIGRNLCVGIFAVIPQATPQYCMDPWFTEYRLRNFYLT